MKDYGLLESIIEYSPTAAAQISLENQKQNKQNEDKGSGLENILKDKVKSFTDILTHITQSIDTRTNISKDVISRIYENYCDIKNELLEIKSIYIRPMKEVGSRKTKLESSLNDLIKEIRQEHVQCFNDIATLWREFRSWLKQYNDLKIKVNMVSKNK